MTRTPTYNSWQAMLQRCTDTGHKHYDRYGGRGITVCERWMTFESFFEDMGLRPKGHTLERIDNNGNYEKSNCRWATRKEQTENRRSTKKVILRGLTITAAEACRQLGIDKTTLYARTKRTGCTYQEAVDFYAAA